MEGGGKGSGAAAEYRDFLYLAHFVLLDGSQPDQCI
jgi:hypothetical protein